MHGLDGREILRHNRLHGTTALLHIAQGAAQDAHIRVRLDENLDIQQVAQVGVLENQDALDDDHFRRAHLDGLVRAVVDAVVIDGAVDRLPGLELLQILDHQIRVERVGVVVILQAALLERAVLALIVVVVVDDADIRAETLGKVLGERGLAAAGAAGDTDKEGVHVLCLPVCFLGSIIGKPRPKSKRGAAEVVKKD